MNKLYLDGYVGTLFDFWSEDIPSTSYKGMRTNLEKLSGDLELHINSKGGDAFEGMAMYGLLKNYTDGEKVALVDGICASAATLPMLAMDTIKAHETAMFLFHKSATMAFGHSNDLRKSADELDEIDETIVNVYMKRFTGTAEELNALLDEDKLISAEKALAYGLIDEIIKEDEQEEPEEQNTNLNTTQKVVANAEKEAVANNNRLYKFAAALSKVVED